MFRIRMSLAATLFSIVLLDSCEPPVKGPSAISVESRPSFTLHGEAQLPRFTVYAPLNGTKIANPYDPSSAIWEIQGPKPHVFGSGIEIEGLRLIYAGIPRGYTQTVPNAPQVTPQLASGKIYSFEGCSTLSGCLFGYFYVDKTGDVAAVDVPSCFVSPPGHGVIRIDCETHSPFHEPADLEKYSREHRRACAFTPTATVAPTVECEPGKAD
jgi:hypothetical protein